MYTFQTKPVSSINSQNNSAIRQVTGSNLTWGQSPAMQTYDSKLANTDRRVNPLFKEVDEELKKLKSQFESMKVDSSQALQQTQVQPIRTTPMQSYSQYDSTGRRLLAPNQGSSFVMQQEEASRTQSSTVQVQPVTPQTNQVRRHESRFVNTFAAPPTTGTSGYNSYNPADNVRSNSIQSDRYPKYDSQAVQNPNKSFTAGTTNSSSITQARAPYQNYYSNYNSSYSNRLTTNSAQPNKTEYTDFQTATASTTTTGYSASTFKNQVVASTAAVDANQYSSVNTPATTNNNTVKYTPTGSSYQSNQPAAPVNQQPVAASTLLVTSAPAREPELIIETKAKPQTAEPIKVSLTQQILGAPQQPKPVTPIILTQPASASTARTNNLLGSSLEEAAVAANQASYSSRPIKTYSTHNFGVNRQKSVSSVNSRYDNTDTQEKVNSLTVSLDVANKQNVNYKAQIETLKTKLLEVESLKEQNSELRNKLLAKQQKIRALQIKAEQSVNLILKHERTIKGLEEENKYFKSNQTKSQPTDSSTVFNEVLKSHIDQVQRYKNKITLLEEEIARLEEVNRSQKSSLETMRNEVEIEKLKKMTELKNAETNHEIEAKSRENEINSLKRIVASLDDKLKYILKEQKKKDEFLMNHLKGKTQNPEEKETITEFFKKFEDVPKINISEIMVQERQENENLREEIRQLTEALETEKSIRKYLH